MPGKIDKPVEDVIPMESLEKDDPNDHPLPYADRPVPKEHTKQTQFNNNATAQESPIQPAKRNTPSITSQQARFALLLLLAILLVSAAIYFSVRSPKQSL